MQASVARNLRGSRLHGCPNEARIERIIGKKSRTRLLPNRVAVEIQRTTEGRISEISRVFRVAVNHNVIEFAPGKTRHRVRSESLPYATHDARAEYF
jgi:hypothetical protein